MRWVTVAFVMVVTSYFVLRFRDTSIKSHGLEQRAAEIQAEIVGLEQETEALATQVARAQSDDYIELIARERLNLRRPGDHPLIIARPDGEEARLATPPAPPMVATSTPAPADQGSFADSLATFGHVGEWLSLFFGSP